MVIRADSLDSTIASERASLLPGFPLKLRGERSIHTPEQKLRARLEQAVDRLLEALDRLDAPAEDLEDVDREEDAGDLPEHDEAELEQSLGAYDRLINQEHSWTPMGSWHAGQDHEVDPGRPLARSAREPVVSNVIPVGTATGGSR
jgi:hypothetical protein